MEASLRAVFVLIAATILLAGCVSAERTRASDPIAEGVFAGQWRDFADCVNFQLGDRILYNPLAEQASISPFPDAFFQNVDAGYELRFQQEGPDTVLVQLRHMWESKSQVFLDLYWQPVENCAAE